MTQHPLVCFFAYSCLVESGTRDSLAVTKRVPTQTALAPSIKVDAMLLPSKMPPAAMSCTGCPVNGDL